MLISARFFRDTPWHATMFSDRAVQGHRVWFGVPGSGYAHRRVEIAAEAAFRSATERSEALSAEMANRRRRLLGRDGRTPTRFLGTFGRAKSTAPRSGPMQKRKA